MSFWDRRKAAVAKEAEREQAAELAEDVAAQEHALAEKPDAELLQEAGFPEPEELHSPEDIQAFLKTALPQRLKTRALRRLWRLNPVLANLDGLVDYGEDYTDAATVIENMQTVYQVGKGMFDKFAEAEPDESIDETPDLAPDETQDADLAAREADANDAPAAPNPDRIAPPVPQRAQEDTPVLQTPAPRRMTFQFDTTQGQT